MRKRSRHLPTVWRLTRTRSATVALSRPSAHRSTISARRPRPAGRLRDRAGDSSSPRVSRLTASGFNGRPRAMVSSPSCGWMGSNLLCLHHYVNIFKGRNTRRSAKVHRAAWSLGSGHATMHSMGVAVGLERICNTPQDARRPSFFGVSGDPQPAADTDCLCRINPKGQRICFVPNGRGPSLEPALHRPDSPSSRDFAFALVPALLPAAGQAGIKKATRPDSVPGGQSPGCRAGPVSHLRWAGCAHARRHLAEQPP